MVARRRMMNAFAWLAASVTLCHLIAFSMNETARETNVHQLRPAIDRETGRCFQPRDTPNGKWLCERGDDSPHGPTIIVNEQSALYDKCIDAWRTVSQYLFTGGRASRNAWTREAAQSKNKVYELMASGMFSLTSFPLRSVGERERETLLSSDWIPPFSSRLSSWNGKEWTYDIFDVYLRVILLLEKIKFFLYSFKCVSYCEFYRTLLRRSLLKKRRTKSIVN